MRLCRIACVLLAAAGVSPVVAEPDWRAQISDPEPGEFARMPSIRMSFSFGWSNLVEAAQAQSALVEKDGRFKLDVAGNSLGFARALWPMDATHKATINSSTLLPIDVEQFEKYRSRTVETELRFDPGGVERHREVSTSKSPPKWKRVNFPSIRDVIGSMLYVRSQPLANGDEIGLVSFPADAPYFVLVTVEGHETVHCMDKEMPAIRLGISVRKLEVEHKEPVRAVNYSKFKSGTAWVSDDSLRLPLRAEVKVFVGFVYGELVDYELVDGSPKTE